MGADVKDICEIHNLGPDTQEWVVADEQVTDAGGKYARYVGHTVARSGYQFGRIAPPFSQILVTEEGEGLALVGGEWRSCPAGFAYVTAPRATSAYHIHPDCPVWRVHWSIYGEERMLPSLPPGAPPRLIPVEATGFRHAVEGLCHEKGSRADPGALGLWAALVDHSVWRMLDAEQGDSRLDRLWLLVRQDLGGKWTLRRMAREAGMSEESLRRLCQKHLQRSPMAHLTRMRLQAAADFLCHTSEKLDALAARVGYGDAFSFSVAFRRFWGVPPSVYRDRHSLVRAARGSRASSAE